MPACSDVDVRTPSTRGEEAVHGTVAPWVAWSASFAGPTGGAAAEATVALAAADESSAGDPWFVRVADYPGIGAALAWDRAVAASPGAPVRRAYRLLVADGRLTDAEVAALLA